MRIITAASIAVAAFTGAILGCILAGLVTVSPTCSVAGHSMQAGATITVDGQGDASSPYNGTGSGFVCTAQGWQRI